jgi:hypothetical protein
MQIALDSTKQHLIISFIHSRIKGICSKKLSYLANKLKHAA